ncbi:hypothetical protein MSG28_012419 [Choristoneura fumiferana]|uniref:Uncharacterized protein n=1 Tax=Choristoneura fumiferana TaxID=7141 RepID=A0ACC0KE63_CHOFU|nr:hypothetical protein MSG28_012419 [Choristoneura fumiferana]
MVVAIRADLAQDPKSFIKIIRRGHDFIRHKACLRFHEQNPIVFAQIANLTYLYYTYSGVLEECCGTYFSKDIGRRLVLITPKCRAPAEVAHATLHALGLVHGKGQGFSQPSVQAVLYPEECMNTEVDHHHENNGHHHHDSRERRPLLDIGLPRGSPLRPVLCFPHPTRSRDLNQVVTPSCWRPSGSSSPGPRTSFENLQ